MSRYQFALLAGAAALTAAALATPALTQQPQQPPFATTKVEGTDGVYIFRNGGAQSMFIVTRDGVRGEGIQGPVPAPAVRRLAAGGPVAALAAADGLVFAVVGAGAGAARLAAWRRGGKAL